jgi:glycosyltransferase involved in cell wall biosynthesis
LKELVLSEKDMEKNNLSVVISVHNGEAHLAECLSSLSDVASEIIVVDHDSTDNTSAIAKTYNVTLYHEKNNPQKIDIQKNFGFSKATKEWILSLDADEEVTPELAKELKTLLSMHKEFVAYEIPRRNIILGKEILHAGWAPDYQLRLFKNGKGKFEKEHVHESLQVDGTVAKISSSLLHHNYDSVSQYLRKMIVYAENEADEKIRSGYSFNWKDTLWMPHAEFLSRYFARQGYKDGLHGLVICLLQAVYHFTIFCFLWEKNNFLEIPEKEIVSEIDTEANKLMKTTGFWLTKVKVERTNSRGKRVSYKILNRIKSSL